MMGRIANSIHGLKPAMMMVVVQAAYAGVNIFYKMAANIGMSLRVLIAYRFLFAAAFIIPLALVIERKKRPKITWVVVFQAFLCGLLGGSLAQNLYAQSLALTSATFAAAMTNLVPAITFIMALTFGMERLGFGTLAGKAKVLGTLLCIGGAMLLTFYKGKEINLWSTKVDLLHHKGGGSGDQLQGGGDVAASLHGNHVVGALLALCCCLSSAAGLIVQTKMMRNYPCPYSSTALMITSGAIQAAVFGLCMDRDWNAWKLGWDLRLLIVSYSGIVASGVVFTLMAWCVQMRGPLFVSVFNPLLLVLVAIAGSLVLNEKLHLGSVLGGAIIVGGLYAVLWGKGKELKRISQLMPSKSSRESGRMEIEIIVTSATEINNSHKDNINSGSINGTSNMVAAVVITDGITTVYSDGAAENSKGPEVEDGGEKGITSSKTSEIV